jgi:hypothetical protein
MDGLTMLKQFVAAAVAVAASCFSGDRAPNAPASEPAGAKSPARQGGH